MLTSFICILCEKCCMCKGKIGGHETEALGNERMDATTAIDFNSNDKYSKLLESCAINPIEAIIFDMDGTLIDSEVLTGVAIRALLQEQGIQRDGHIDEAQFYGCTWRSIAAKLLDFFPELTFNSSHGIEREPTFVEKELQKNFHRNMITTPPPEIPGAAEFVLEAGNQLRVIIVSSSQRESIETTIARLGIGIAVNSGFLGAEDYSQSKPAPDCFLRGAAQLGVEPSRCLVFEDSIAGITAARTAGMRVVGITHRCVNHELVMNLCDLTVNNYQELGGRAFIKKLIEASLLFEKQKLV